MHMIKFNDIWEQKLFPLLMVRGWKYRRGGENIVTIFSPRGEDIVGVKISSHTGLQTLTGKIWVGPTSFPSLSYINFGKIVVRSEKFQILFWRLV